MKLSIQELLIILAIVIIIGSFIESVLYDELYKFIV